jgi:Do/DeqQ family serine protease
MKNIAKILLVSMLGGILTLGSYKLFIEEEHNTTIIEAAPTAFKQTALSSEVLSFTEAAERTVNSVVHVKTAIETRGAIARTPFEFFFGNPSQSLPRLQMASGSGVIISRDGYIVTNNHVVNNAETIQISLNDGKEYKAVVVGTDPTTDIALVKIDVENAPFLTFSNSDEVRLGEWVLAVGNPFNLTSTVTAGIISAKGRSLGIIDDQSAIESFLQTDAVVNPGNSGGALVNTRGDLIGINTAISTHTGSFEGYSFAVPSNIVKKVVEDLLEFGTVQRAFIGVNISDITPKIAAELDLSQSQGVYVGGVTNNGAAQEAGIETGDIIVGVNGTPITKSSELQEMIGRKRPGDEVQLQVVRDSKKKAFAVTLKNINGTTNVVKREAAFSTRLGAQFSEISSKVKSRYGITYGLEVDALGSGIFAEQGIPQGFVLTHINRQKISSEKDIDEAVKGLSKGDPVVIQGFLPNGRSKYYAFGF